MIDLDIITPIEERGGVFIKREDLFHVAGVNGGKVRSCWTIATALPKPLGLVTAGARTSPQANIVAQIARLLQIPCRVHTPSGQLGEQLILAQKAGAEVVQHKPGYNTVIIKRAADDAKERDWRIVPFGMESPQAALATRRQFIQSNIRELPIKRIVVPVGSGMSLAGILQGMVAEDVDVPVIGVAVGADPTNRLNTYAPFGWSRMVKIIKSPTDYHRPASIIDFHGLELDEIYEAKCLSYLEQGDLFWVVGSRNKLED